MQRRPAYLEAVGGEQDGADADAGVDGGLHGDHEVKHPPGSCARTVQDIMSTKHKSQFNQQLVATIHKHSNAPTMLI